MIFSTVPGRVTEGSEIGSSCCCTKCCTNGRRSAQKHPKTLCCNPYCTTTYAKLGRFVIDRSAVQFRSSAVRELIVRMARENPARCLVARRGDACRTRNGSPSSSNPNVGAFVSRAKERLRNSLNALNGVNGGIDSLCAGRWLVSYLFVTANR